MALMNGIMNDMPKYVAIGNRNDYCELCARDLHAKNDVEYNKAFQSLKGAHEGKKIIKFTKGGATLCICKGCLEKLGDLLKEE